MGVYPILKPRELLRALLRAGFYIHHQTGSHVRLLHRFRKELRVTIPIHNKDIPVEILKRILTQANLDINALQKIL